jgi:predicted DNA-binding protein
MTTWARSRSANSRRCTELSSLADTLHATLRRVRKTSVYLSERESRRLVELARAEGRSQAEIIREAIAAYVPPARDDDNFALASGFRRLDRDPRPISEIPEDELLDGFGR